jgi:hypothetical protein
MDNDKEMTEHESLMIIQQMIDTAKQEQKDDGKGWIVWGWMLFTASVLTVINLRTGWVNVFFFWNLLGVATLIIFAVEIYRDLSNKKGQKVRTYTKAIFKTLNIGFFICLMFIIVGMNVAFSPLRGFPLLVNLYAFWILIYGALLNFKPSIVGAFIAWALAFVSLFMNTFEEVMLMHAAAVLCGYIIPGHIANKRFKDEAGRKSLNQQQVV